MCAGCYVKPYYFTKLRIYFFSVSSVMRVYGVAFVVFKVWDLLNYYGNEEETSDVTTIVLQPFYASQLKMLSLGKNIYFLCS